MTLVIGRQFFNRLVILSDTMISDEASTGTNIIPGRLKSIVLSQDIAVSFSGLANQACGTIRRLYGDVLNGLNLPSILESLRNSTQMFNGEVSFLLACRVPKLALYKVSDGQVNSGSDRYWIGDPRAASEVQRIMEIEEEHIHAKLKDDEFFSPAEVAFTAAFMSLVLEQRIPGVGGICFNCLGSEHGFCYQNVAEMYAWDPILIGAGFDPEAVYRRGDLAGGWVLRHGSVLAEHSPGAARARGHVGGGGSAASRWAWRLPPQERAGGVELPGRPRFSRSAP